jgi:protein kinase-like protein
MGQVWLARDERSGLDVALKIVPREGKSAARAEREARAAAALRHPRCQRIYALARDSGHVYISYEYVPGRTMRQALQAGDLDDRQAVEVASQVLEALAHAHGRGIVHRDVKPSNVLLAETEGIDARLLDFGLAQMAEFDTLTALGDVPGTLGYVSPERLLGKTATEAADIWAVGVMLWEALAGEHPFREGSLPETSRRIQSGPPALASVRPDLPAALCEAVSSALVLNPERRPSARTLADNLRNLPRKRRRQGGRDKGGAAAAIAARPQIKISAQVRNRLVPGALAALATGWVATALPFYPAGWPLGLAIAAATIGFAAPRAGLAFALASPILPLGNISLGLAIAYAVLAAGWLALSWNDARSGLLAAIGPLLAPIGGLGLMPLAALAARGRVRRFAQAFAAVLVAAVVAGFRHLSLPFAGSLPPLGLGIAGSNRPGAVAYALWHALLDRPAVLWGALVLGAATAVLPELRHRGPWPAACYGAALMIAAVLVAPAVAVIPLIGAAWLTAAVLALEPAN